MTNIHTGEKKSELFRNRSFRVPYDSDRAQGQILAVERSIEENLPKILRKAGLGG